MVKPGNPDPDRILESTEGEQDLIRRLFSDSLVISMPTNNLRVRRTSSRMCFSVEHGDYNGTRLFGAAIGVEPEKTGDANGFIWLAYAPTDNGRVKIKSLNFPGAVADFKLGQIADPSEASRPGFPWTKFPMGVDYVLRKNGFQFEKGINGVLIGKIPEGGLSRSASLTLNLMLSLFEANGMFAGAMDPFSVINMARQVENEYIGSPCGDLDQAMIYLGKFGNGTVYSSRQKLIRHVRLPRDTPDFRLVVLDTGTKRAGLKGATYETRQKECRQIVDMFGQKYGFSALADVTPAIYPHLISDIEYSKLTDVEKNNLSGRLSYIFHANLRFDKMLGAWQDGDIHAIGEIMDADGRGLRSEYQISGPQLETMVDAARTDPYFLGGRMAGGGDFGAAQGIRLNKPIADFRNRILIGYGKSWPEYRQDAAVHNCQLVDGCVRLI